MPTSHKLIIAVGVVLVVWYLLWNTNFGKKLTAQLGLRECYEVTLTGQVVCGEQAERIEQLRNPESGVPSCEDIEAALKEGECIEP